MRVVLVLISVFWSVKPNFDAQAEPVDFFGIELRNKKGKLLDECNDRIKNCLLPVILPYYGLTSRDEVIERARQIHLSKHCSIGWDAYACMKKEFKKGTCIYVHKRDPDFVNEKFLPNLADALEYLCKTEFKRFNNNKRCLVTTEVFNTLIRIRSATPDCSEKIKRSIDGDDLEIREVSDDSCRWHRQLLYCMRTNVEPLCGKTAAALTTELFHRLRGRKQFEDCFPTEQ